MFLFLRFEQHLKKIKIKINVTCIASQERNEVNTVLVSQAG